MAKETPRAAEPRPGRWNAEPLRPRRRFRDVAWMLGVSIWLVGIVRGQVGGFAAWLDAALLGAWTLAFVGLGAGLTLREALARRRSGRDLAFADRTAGVEEFSVEIVVGYGKRTVGADRGVVWFEGGLLGFSGERTSFRIACADLAPPRGQTLTDMDLPFLPLRLRAGRGEGTLEVRPLWGEGRRYRRALRRFFAERAPAEAARQWPPFRSYASDVQGSGRNGLQHAVPLQEDVDERSLRVGKLNEG